MINIFLDDERDPKMVFPGHVMDWIVVRNYKEFVAEVKKHPKIDFISFDHDLGFKGKIERSGMTCAKFLCEYCMDNHIEAPSFFVHSGNPAGKDNIASYMNSFIKHQKTNGI